MEQGKAVALGLALGAGGVGMVQVLVNSALGRVVGSYQAGLVSGVGTALTLALVSVFAGGFGRLGADPVPWHYAGGVLGAIYLTASLIAVRALGATGVTAALIAGQLGLAVVIDQLGLLGATRDPATAGKLLGVVLLAAGVGLIVRAGRRTERGVGTASGWSRLFPSTPPPPGRRADGGVVAW